MADVEVPDPGDVAEKAENPFTRRVALCVAVYAVALAIASFGGNSTGDDIMLAKMEESNRWSQYQSKATREALYKNEVQRLEFEREDAGTLPLGKQKMLERYQKEEARMKASKTVIAKGGEDEGEQIKGALEFQAEVKHLQRKDPYFDAAEIVLQLAIVLASVAMLANKKWAFYASLLLFFVGAAATVNGFALLVAVPGME